MIFYGTSGTQFATASLPQAACPACHTVGQLRASLVSHYAHLYWVPLFPFQKRAGAQCGACGTSWPDYAWPAALAPALRLAKQQHPHPYRSWAGLGLLALAALGTYGYGLREQQLDEALLASPRTGDIYTVRSVGASAYSLLKVLRAGGNGVELVANEYQTPDSDPISSLNDSFRYSKEPFVVTRLDLQIMRRKGELTDVDRP